MPVLAYASAPPVIRFGRLAAGAACLLMIPILNAPLWLGGAEFLQWIGVSDFGLDLILLVITPGLCQVALLAGTWLLAGPLPQARIAPRLLAIGLAGLSLLLTASACMLELARLLDWWGNAFSLWLTDLAGGYSQLYAVMTWAGVAAQLCVLFLMVAGYIFLMRLTRMTQAKGLQLLCAGSMWVSALLFMLLTANTLLQLRNDAFIFDPIGELPVRTMNLLLLLTQFGLWLAVALWARRRRRITA